jgi:hypothetical protein
MSLNLKRLLLVFTASFLAALYWFVTLFGVLIVDELNREIKSNHLIEAHKLPKDVEYSCFAGKIHYKVDLTVIRYEPLTDCLNGKEQ